MHLCIRCLKNKILSPFMQYAHSTEDSNTLICDACAAEEQSIQKGLTLERGDIAKRQERVREAKRNRNAR